MKIQKILIMSLNKKYNYKLLNLDLHITVCLILLWFNKKQIISNLFLE